MEKCVITGSVRTAVGKYLGSLKTVPATELCSCVMQEVLKRSCITKEQVDHVIMGEVLGVGNLARASALQTGYPIETPAYTVDRQCGSALQAVINATQEINAGASEIVVAGGAENMSRGFYVMPPSVRYEGFRLGHVQTKDIFMYDSENCQPPSIYPGLNMGITAENIASKYGLTREAQDEFAYHSQMKTKAAMERGAFKEEIIPFTVKMKKGSFIFDHDEDPRPDTTMETLGKLRPAFVKDGTVTAGNASGMNDGASAVVVMSEEKARVLGICPMVRIVSSAVTGVDPQLMGLGPVSAIRKALRLADLTLQDIDLFELNEAFAAQALGCLKELDMLPGTELYERVNVNGGAIAHGHALGNSGTRLLNTLIYELKRRKARYGLASLCIGGGQGIAMVVENVL